MQILIREATIIDPSSKHNGKTLDVLINDGTISSIGKDLDATLVEEVIEGEDLHISGGWVDLYATFGDPGTEYKEDIVSGLNAAAHGGFTKVSISPATDPVVDSKSGIEYILTKAKGHAVDALPLGAMTKKLVNTDLAEMYDMKNAGAVGISNGRSSVQDAKLQNLALLYSKNLKLPIYSFAQDERISNGGQMHEGQVNTRLGLTGSPALAEELIVARDLYLAEYSEVKVHFSHITTAGSVDLIRKAKDKGLKVSASVPAHHLLITDASAEAFDANFKASPPFRDQAHIDALIAGLKDGTIDAIISDHEPHEIEAKFSEFSRAESGIIALETAFSVAYEALKDHMNLDAIISKFTDGPRSVLSIAHPCIEEGKTAELTVFCPRIDWEYSKDDIRSKSKNSPVIGRKLQGLPVAVVNNGQLFLNV